jgi:hypothetical protein
MLAEYEDDRMEITLKKASDLSKAALAASNQIKVAKSVRLSIYGSIDPVTLIRDAEHKATSQIDTLFELINLHYALRKFIGEENDRVGITGFLRDAAKYEAIIKAIIAQLKSIDPDDETSRLYGRASEALPADLGAISERINLSRERIKNPDNSGVVEDSFQVSAIQLGLLEYLKEQLFEARRQKAYCSEQLAFLNITSKIRIDEITVAMLKKHKLL